jgi:hypothetical protein
VSRVTTVIVSIGPEPADVQEALGRDLYGVPGLRPLTRAVSAASMWGGTKRPQLDLWGGAFNHLDWRVLFAHLEAVAWTEPDAVQVLISGEESSRLGLYELRGRRLAPRNVEAAVQVMTLGVVDDLIEPDGSRTPIREDRATRPRTEEELAILVDQVMSAIAPASRDALAAEIRSLLSPDD